MNKRPVFIIGMMGSGKTTNGKKLAKLLDYQFIDLDMAIENHVKTPTQSIFENKGELYFRDLETRLLKENTKPKTLISCGGGTPCFNDNLKTIKRNGAVIYFKASNEALVHRLSNAKIKRPLLLNLNESQMLDKLNDLLSKREVYYNQADLMVDALSLSSLRLIELTKSIKRLS
jgi:shikimate kinase